MSNVAILTGNVGNVETRQLPSGGTLTVISLATTKRWKDKETGQPQERTTWHRCKAFGRRGEILAEHCAKGQGLYVRGEISHNEWVKNVGGVDVPMRTTEIEIEDFEFLGSKPQQGNVVNHQARPNGQQQQQAQPSQPQQQQQQPQRSAPQAAAANGGGAPEGWFDDFDDMPL